MASTIYTSQIWLSSLKYTNFIQTTLFNLFYLLKINMLNEYDSKINMLDEYDSKINMLDEYDSCMILSTLSVPIII